MVIFLSANTLFYCYDILSKAWQEISQQSNRPKIVAIGAATQKALQQAGLPVDLLPRDRFNSEGLLALPELQRIQVANQKVLIIAGKSGRTLLSNTLKERGAVVSKVDAYCRTQPKGLSNTVIDHFNKRLIDIVVCTSNESLSNLFAILPPNLQTTLIDIQLLGVSKRINPLAQQLGLTKVPLIADNASDDAIINALKLFQRDRLMTTDEKDNKNNKDEKIKQKTKTQKEQQQKKKQSAAAQITSRSKIETKSEEEKSHSNCNERKNSSNNRYSNR